jgi:hypothetical protein
MSSVSERGSAAQTRCDDTDDQQMSEPAGGYIRGGAGLATDSRHVLRVTLAAGLASLALLTLALLVAALHANATHERLQNHGVAVQVTVTGCVGTATGTGITVNGFSCRGEFVLAGRHYNDVIGGSAQLRPRGSSVRGVTDPHSPSTLSTAAAVAATRSSVRPFVLAAIPAMLLVLIAGFARWSTRRVGMPPHRRRARAGQALA